MPENYGISNTSHSVPVTPAPLTSKPLRNPAGSRAGSCHELLWKDRQILAGAKFGNVGNLAKVITEVLDGVVDRVKTRNLETLHFDPIQQGVLAQIGQDQIGLARGRLHFGTATRFWSWEARAENSASRSRSMGRPPAPPTIH